MAARYAVTTGNWTGAIWAATAGGAAGSAAVPTSADDVTINKNVTVTVDALTCVANSITFSIGTTGADVGGKLNLSQVTSAKLVVQAGITAVYTANPSSTGTYSSTVDFDLSAVPSISAEIVLNNARATGAGAGMVLAGNWTLKGAPRKRWCRLSGGISAGATSATVSDATGWVVGDKICFATTSAHPTTTYIVTASSWSGGYLTCTVASTTGLIKGAQVVMTNMQANLNVNWVVYDVPDATHFTIAMSDPTVTDGVGTATLQPRTDEVTLATVNTGTGAITWTDGAAAGGGVAFDHADNAPVGNFTSNLWFHPNTPSDNTWVRVADGAGSGLNACACDDVAFWQMGTGTATGATAFGVATGRSAMASISNNAFYDSRGGIGIPPLYLRSVVSIVTRQNNIFWGPVCNALGGQDVSGSYAIGPDEYYAVFRSDSSSWGLLVLFPSQHQIGHVISGVRAPAADASGNIRINKVGVRVEACDIWSCASGVQTSGGVVADSCRFGSEVFAGCDNTTNMTTADGTLTAIDCLFPATLARSGASLYLPQSRVIVVNRDADPAVQEIYGPHSNTVPIIQRDGSPAAGARSTSALLMTCNAGTAIEHSFEVLAKAGETIRVLVYVMKSGTPAYGASTLPSVTVSGLGITPVTVAMGGGTAADTWELLTLDATNSGAADGNLTVTLTAQSSTAGAKAWFAGVPVSPFVSRCRHYGYLFNETSPTRTADITKSATEATAAAYYPGELTFSWSLTAGSSTSTVITDSTFQRLYDGHQAQACLNVGSALALTGAGVAGSPALFAAGNVTTTGYTLNGGGSLAMGANTLTATDYTYTGGTFSQLTSTPAFSGGTVSIAAEGTYGYTLSSCGVEFGEAGTGWDLSGATISGTIAFTTSTGSLAVTVAVPTGTSYTVEGSNITVTAPIVSADISITGMANTGGANNRLQIINSSVLAASDWQAATVYAAGDVVLRTSGIGSENTAGLYMRCTSDGTSHATTEPTWDTTVGNTTTDNSVTWTTYAVLYYDADPAATSLTDTYIDGEEFAAGETIEIRFAEEDPGVTFKTYSTSVVATADGFSALVNETADDVYATYALSGAAYEATFSPNYAANYIVLDANTDFSGKAAYAYYCYLLTTSSGMYRFWGGLTGIDAGNIRNNVGTISLYFDESAGFVKQTDDVRIFRSDNTRPAIDPTTGGSGIEINWRVPVNVVSIATASVLSPSESAQLMSLPSATSIAAAVWAYVVSGSTTAVQMMRIFAAVLAGKVSGAGTGTETFRGINDDKDRVVATTDSSGNRTAITLDGS